MQQNHQVIIRQLPEGNLTEAHFELKVGEVPVLEPGQVLMKTRLMSIDAANRAWMQGATYRAAVNAGDVMPTYAIGEVLESQDPSLSPGDLIAAESSWAEYVAIPARYAQKLTPVEPLSNLLSVLGIAGKTAYHGLVDVGRPNPGETVVVSAAAGSVGMFVGQIAKALGCRAVGIAGGEEKCAWVTETLGFDACVDYRAGNLFKDLKAACPDGVDVYFDNVGGKVLETVLFQMNQNGRIVCCGAVSQYDGDAPSGPRNLPGLVVVKRLRMEGFIVMDYAEKDAEAIAALKEWVDAGKIHVAEDIVEGLAAAPGALVGLLAGKNRGKRMVRVS
ncbi:MAG: NADP-dependent oxidoreductase [Burkholderiaceae bacterium]